MFCLGGGQDRELQGVNVGVEVGDANSAVGSWPNASVSPLPSSELDLLQLLCSWISIAGGPATRLSAAGWRSLIDPTSEQICISHSAPRVGEKPGVIP